MRSKAQLQETIQRFQDCFWDRKTLRRPVVGIHSNAVFLPINFVRRPLPRTLVKPEDVTPDLSVTESDYWFRNRDREVSCNDQIAFPAA